MAAGIAALGALAAKGGMAAKGIWAGMNLNKLMMLLFGGQMAMDAMGGVGKYALGGKQVGLGGKQMEMQVGLGRREEARTDELIRRLERENQKQYLRGERSKAQERVSSSADRDTQMAMSMIMALSGLQQEETQIANRRGPSSASMLGLMR
jgi:hypothetical protein